MKSLLKIALFTLSAFFTVCAQAQTTQLNQTGPGTNCHVTGCTNMPLSDGELMTFGDTLAYYGSYPINGKLLFRGMHYQISGNSSGYQLIDLSGAGFSLHEDFAVHCYRGCSNNWLNGYLEVPSKYVTSDPSYYGNSGYPNYTCICSGNGQVGFIVAPTTATVVTLVTDNPSVIQVPANVTVSAGSLYADFAITANVPNTGIGPLYTVTITATFPDGTTATFPLTVQNLPPPTPPDNSMLIYPCGSERKPCFQKGR